MLLFRLSPMTVSVPLLKLAVVAALADWLRPTITPAPMRVPRMSRRAARLDLKFRVFMVLPLGSVARWGCRQQEERPRSLRQTAVRPDSKVRIAPSPNLLRDYRHGGETPREAPTSSRRLFWADQASARGRRTLITVLPGSE